MSAGLLESALISGARRCGAHTVVTSAPVTTYYARLLRRALYRQAGIDARLVAITGVTSGALGEDAMTFERDLRSPSIGQPTLILHI